MPVILAYSALIRTRYSAVVASCKFTAAGLDAALNVWVVGAPRVPDVVQGMIWTSIHSDPDPFHASRSDLIAAERDESEASGSYRLIFQVSFSSLSLDFC